MNYSKVLKKLREDNKLTNIEMGRLLNISDSMYNRYEKQNQIIPIKHIETLSNYFNVSVDYILGFTNIKNYKNTNFLNIEKSVLRLKEFRNENKLTQVVLAKKLNIANGTSANYERGRNVIATPFLYTICKNYNVSADYILGKIDKLTYNNSRG